MRSSVLAVVLLTCLLVPAAAVADDGHYLVFEVRSAHDIRLLFHARTAFERSTWPRVAAASAPTKAAAHGGLVIHARGYSGRALVHAESLDLHRLARAEAHADGSLVPAGPVALPSTSFALRLPAAVDRLLLDAGVTIVDLDLAEVAASSQQLPLAHYSAATTAVAKRDHGPPSNRVDLLVIAEGYRADEEALFEQRADAFEAGFFQYAPFHQYRPLFNVHRLFVASAQSGADHPPYRADCTGPDCCRDAAAQNDPLAPRFVETAFDATFCIGGSIHRALGVNVGKLLVAAAAVPDWDVLVVLVNDPVYGGLGYTPNADGSLPGIAVGSAPDLAIPLIVHELGHSLGKLGDEYTFGGTPQPPYCSDRPTPGACLDNHTDDSDPARAKWRAWFTPGQPVPTRMNQLGVGLFPGALDMPQGIYRPTARWCLMRDLSVNAFCPVCAEALVATLFDGRFGDPAQGVDLIEPGSESPAPGRPVVMRPGQGRRFQASVLQPLAATLERQWLLDGEPLTNGNEDFIDLSLDAAGGTARTLEFRVVDRGRLLRSERFLPLTVHSRTWDLRLVEDGHADFAICPQLSGAWFHPETPGQGILLDVVEQPPLLFGGWFTWADPAGTRQWFTLQGEYASGEPSVSAVVFESRGGRFDQADPVVTEAVGEVELHFLDCAQALLDYSFDDGRSGSVPLQRLLTPPEGCVQACRR